MPARRQRKLDALVTRLQVQYGPRAISRATAPPTPTPIPHISTTFPELDAALGIGGLPRGRISQISGPVTSGKVTLAARVLSAAQREPEAMVAWLDLSRTCDPDYLHRCGPLSGERTRANNVRPPVSINVMPNTINMLVTRKKTDSSSGRLPRRTPID